jgi:hypothetical protein
LPSAYAVKNIKQRNIVLRVVIHYAKKVHPRRLLVSRCALFVRFAARGFRLTCVSIWSKLVAAPQIF